MEESLGKVLQIIRECSSPALESFIDKLIESNDQFKKLLDLSQAELHKCERLPEIEPELVMGPESNWQQLTQAFNPSELPNSDDLVILWSVYAVIDRAEQYYRQAAQFSMQQQERLFFSSLAELKGKLRRKIDFVQRIISNQVWSVVGFSPGKLAKE